MAKDRARRKWNPKHFFPTYRNMLLLASYWFFLKRYILWGNFISWVIWRRKSGLCEESDRVFFTGQHLYHQFYQCFLGAHQRQEGEVRLPPSSVSFTPAAVTHSTGGWMVPLRRKQTVRPLGLWLEYLAVQIRLATCSFPGWTGDVRSSQWVARLRAESPLKSIFSCPSRIYHAAA